MSSEIVPFGKYKGRPIEVMTADQQYVEWLMQQPWFRDKYTNVYNTIINYAQEPAETPEHNALQIRFLDPVFQEKFIRYTLPKGCPVFQTDGWGFVACVNFEVGNPPVDVIIAGMLKRRPNDKEAQERLESAIRNHETRVLEIMSRNNVWEDIIKRSWYFNEIPDVPSIKDCNHEVKVQFKHTIEIKPTIGDDYPAIFRQMKKSGAEILLVETYTGKGASEEQLRAFFKTGGVWVIFVRELG